MTGRFESNTLEIVTPEGVTFSLKLAGPVTRFLAWLTDFFCIMAAHQMLNNLLQLLNLVSRDLYQAVAVILFFIISIGYAIVMEWFFSGQTFGKRLFRLRVMDARGLRLKFSQVVIRNLLRFVDLLPALYLAGGIAMVLSRRNARIGDIAGSTVVVREDRVQKPDLKQVLPDKFNSLKGFPHLCARLRQKTSQPEADIALNALFRRQTLDPADRVRVFGALGRYFKERVPFPEEALDGVSDEQYIRNIVEILYRPDQ